MQFPFFPRPRNGLVRGEIISFAGYGYSQSEKIQASTIASWMNYVHRRATSVTPSPQYKMKSQIIFSWLNYQSFYMNKYHLLRLWDMDVFGLQQGIQ
jgi:hypothetical protein